MTTSLIVILLALTAVTFITYLTLTFTKSLGLFLYGMVFFAGCLYLLGALIAVSIGLIVIGITSSDEIALILAVITTHVVIKVIKKILSPPDPDI